MADTIIKVQNLSKSYALYDHKIDRLKEALDPRRKKYHHDFSALRNINFEIKKGEAVGIVGENGSGKSTLLKIIAGVLSPTEGLVEARGRIGAILELGTGFNPELTGMENLYFSGTLMGLTLDELNAKKDSILAFADIGEFIHQPVKTYSSGMMMRLAFAVQTSVDPEILIVDEALSVGDVFFQAKCMRRIRNMLSAGTTVFFVTHALSSVKEICTRALLLHHGELVKDADPAAVVQHYLMLAAKNKNDTAHLASVSAESDSASLPDTGEKNLSELSVRQALEGHEKFIEHARPDRIQSGQAEFLNVSLLDTSGAQASLFDFGQQVICRMVIRVNAPVKNLWVGYKIRTVTGVDIIHADSSLYELLDFPYETGKTYVVEWKFEMKLCHGAYVLGCALGLPNPPTGIRREMRHVDIIQTARAFNVHPRAQGMVGPTAVWDNQLQIKQVKD